MSEWFKEHAWKVCVPQKGTQGSNPCLSAALYFIKIKKLNLFWIELSALDFIIVEL